MGIDKTDLQAVSWVTWLLNLGVWKQWTGLSGKGIITLQDSYLGLWNWSSSFLGLGAGFLGSHVSIDDHESGWLGNSWSEHVQEVNKHMLCNCDLNWTSEWQTEHRNKGGYEARFPYNCYFVRANMFKIHIYTYTVQIFKGGITGVDRYNFCWTNGRCSCAGEPQTHESFLSYIRICILRCYVRITWWIL